MTRIGRRGIVKALRAPAPDPPAELGRRIKDQIPEDLFSTARPAAPARASRSRGRASWALAASIVVAIGAGYLAARRFDEQRDSSPELAAAVDAVEAPSPAPVAPAPAAQPPRAQAPQAQAPAAQARAAPPPAPRKAEAIGASRPEPAEQESRRDLDLAESTAPSRRVERLEERLADAAVESLDLQRAPAPAAAMKQNGALGDSERDARADGGLFELAGELLDTAAVRPNVATGAIHVEGTPARAPGRFWALVSVVAARSSAGDGLPSADAIEVELESTAARRYRLLASSAQLVATPGPSAGRAASAPLYRLSALYEIELAPAAAGARASAPPRILGAVRWRGGEASAPGSPDFERVTIDSAGAAARWDDARAELRLAVLAFELTQLPRDAPAARIAPIEHDLDRLLADTADDPALARRAAELRVIAAGLAKAPDTSATDEPPVSPARRDG